MPNITLRFDFEVVIPVSMAAVKAVDAGHRPKAIEEIQKKLDGYFEGAAYENGAEEYLLNKAEVVDWSYDE